MSSDFFILAYASAARHPFSDAELFALLEQSRARNAAADITGLLLYQDGNFLQTLEGPEEAVRETLARIVRDNRHHTIIELLEDRLPTRLFGQWSMGFKEGHTLSEAQHPGLSNFLQHPDAYVNTALAQHDLLIFLRTFRDQLL